MKFYYGIIVLFFIVSNAMAQVKNDYDKYVETAEDFFQSKEYIKAAQNYSKAFISNNNLGRVDHRYSAAQSWALGGEVDSAFFQLNKIAKANHSANFEMNLDTSLTVLRKDPRWTSLMALVKENKEKEYKKLLNPQVAAMLDTVYLDDQTLRRKLDELEKQNGQLTQTELTRFMEFIKPKDAANLVKVKWVLDKYGWLGEGDVGERGKSTLFLVIQHADLATQIKYLPMMRAAVKKGIADASNLALLEDRTLLGQGKKQIYGSQLRFNNRTGKNYVLPLEDPENVDKRRLAMGLNSMKDYVGRWGLIWSVDQYNRDLKEDDKPRTLGELRSPNKGLYGIKSKPVPAKQKNN